MNGISSMLKDEIKKSGDKKHQEKFKLFLTVLVTNIMIAILCLPSGESKTEIKLKKKPFHANHQMMSIPLNVLATDLDANEIPVTLISKDKKVIIEKAWLHELVKTEGEIPQFKIEIMNTDIIRVSEFVDTGMVAIPYVKKTKKKTSLTRGSRYEISM